MRRERCRRERWRRQERAGLWGKIREGGREPKTSIWSLIGHICNMQCRAHMKCYLNHTRWGVATHHRCRTTNHRGDNVKIETGCNLYVDFT
ncbi:hypothetical protein TSUD_308130 [Trifolium subterraneum]|nr:hypothetical protein TSUD_308130 [Trifolium subterraneum]